MPKAYIVHDTQLAIHFAHIIHEEDVLSFAQSNYGKELTDEELTLVSQGLSEDGDAHDCLMQAISHAIDYAIGDKSGEEL